MFIVNEKEGKTEGEALLDPSIDLMYFVALAIYSDIHKPAR